MNDNLTIVLLLKDRVNYTLRWLDFANNYLNNIKIIIADGGKDKNIESSASSVTSAANQIYDGMHNIIRKLRPGSLDNLGLSETIKDTINRWNKQYLNIKFQLKRFLLSQEWQNYVR